MERRLVAYKNGAPVRIRDIGVAVDGPENSKVAAWGTGKRSILLIVYKQPGANVIDTVARIEAKLPQALLSVPSSIKVDKIVDRTTTIRASVQDVSYTMMLTIALVIMVIFLFLRNFWATVIPGVTVPLALIATVGLMYVGRLQLRQSVAHGADHRRRLCRRRCHRHDGEHLSPYRERPRAARGGDQGCGRDRLYHRLDQRVVGSRLHPASADGRDCRTPVP